MKTKQIFQIHICILKFYEEITKLILNSVTAELIKDIIREREVKDDIERQLSQEQKLRGE